LAKIDLQNGSSHSFFYLIDKNKNEPTLLPYDNQRTKTKTTSVRNPPTGGASFLNMEGIVDIKGASKTYLCATETATYEDIGVFYTFEDIVIPEEKEKRGGIFGVWDDIVDHAEDAWDWVKENKDYLINAAVGALVVVGSAALIIVSCGTAAPVLMVAAATVAGGLYCVYKATEQDMALGEARSTWDMVKVAWNGAKSGALIGLSAVLSHEIPIFRTPIFSSALAVVNGTQMRSLKVGWDRTLTDKQKRDYIYNLDQMGKEAAVAGGISALLNMLIPGVSGLAGGLGGGNLPLPDAGGAGALPAVQAGMETLATALETLLELTPALAPALANAISGNNILPASGQDSGGGGGSGDLSEGLVEGRPEVESGSKKIRSDTGKVKSEDFKDFLEEQGETPSKWRYKMETWIREDGSTYERHYWTDGTNSYYHK